jgi:hypothetical protein
MFPEGWGAKLSLAFKYMEYTGISFLKTAASNTTWIYSIMYHSSI